MRRHEPRVSVEAARHGFWPNEVQPSLPIEDDVHWDDKPKAAWPLWLDPDLPTDALSLRAWLSQVVSDLSRRPSVENLS